MILQCILDCYCSFAGYENSCTIIVIFAGNDLKCLMINSYFQEHMFANLSTGECVWEPPVGELWLVKIRIMRLDTALWLVDTESCDWILISDWLFQVFLSRRQMRVSGGNYSIKTLPGQSQISILPTHHWTSFQSSSQSFQFILK